MSRGWPWPVLGIRRTADERAIRSAYATRLKAMDPDADVTGFADLREARDAALWQARDAAAQDEGDRDLLAGDPLALPDDGDGPPAADGALPDYALGAVDLSDRPHAGEAATTLAAPPPPDMPDRRLADLIFPGDEHSEDPMTLEEFAEAEALADRMIADAQAGDIADQQRFDGWFGEVLAQGWPRSAPLVEKAADAFGWMEQSGAIGERPALQFLTTRLRGMRFHEKVTRPGHPLHKIWVELSRPGKATVIDRLRIGRDDARRLLGGIRERYPELESFLDAERVASWERERASGFGVVRILFIGFLCLQVLRLYVAPDFSSTAEAPGPAPEQYDAAAFEAFGAGHRLGDVKSADEYVYNRLAGVLAEGAGPSLDTAAMIEAGNAYVRSLTMAARDSVPRDDLVAVQRLRADLLAVATRDGADACRAFLTSGTVPNSAAIPESVRDRERALAWRLLAAHRLRVEGSSGEKRAPIPQWIGERLVQRTGLSAERINVALHDAGSDDACPVRRALIEAALERPADTPDELLRII